MKIVIIGQGGHSKVINDIILSFEGKVIAYLDDKYEAFFYQNDQYFGPISSAKYIISKIKNIKFVIGIGDNKVRKSIYERLALPTEFYATLIHKSAIISQSASIESGSVIMARTVVNANTRIGKHSIINTGSIVEHDNRISNFVHISPNATLTGSVTINEGVHIGAGATVIPNVSIGEWSVIGAGAAVITDIPAYRTAVGVPAKLKIKNVTEDVGV
ncbi:acetyltransferase [Metabacillus litoralis]|uniref:Acetyltransferase n=1 Tax=Metabacillus litoralis TaxID=152268 RepID=A0A179SUR6_9BACI|nr:acetyltransferase [Metabacillus litoralis]OAS85134.1 acetyltransferase [Metabacillus litoralis]